MACSKQLCLCTLLDVSGTSIRDIVCIYWYLVYSNPLLFYSSNKKIVRIQLTHNDDVDNYGYDDHDGIDFSNSVALLNILLLFSIVYLNTTIIRLSLSCTDIIFLDFVPDICRFPGAKNSREDTAHKSDDLFPRALWIKEQNKRSFFRLCALPHVHVIVFVSPSPVLVGAAVYVLPLLPGHQNGSAKVPVIT